MRNPDSIPHMKKMTDIRYAHINDAPMEVVFQFPHVKHF